LLVLFVQFLRLAEGILWAPQIHLRVVKTGIRGLCFELVESLTFAQFGSRWPLQNDFLVRVICPWAGKVLSFLFLDAAAHRNLNSCRGILSLQVGPRSRRIGSCIKRLPLSLADGVALSFEDDILVLWVVLNEAVATWLGDGDLVASLSLYFLEKLIFGELCRSWRVGE